MNLLPKPSLGMPLGVPTGATHTSHLELLVSQQIPFTFVRFSDGEVEVLRNRKLIISDGVTEFRGIKFRNKFHEHDRRTFNPASDQELRKDLLAAAFYNEKFYFKGIRTFNSIDPHSVIDREFLLRLHGGFDEWITFADLFANENYDRSISKFIPSLANSSDYLYVIANWRAKLSGCLSGGVLLTVPDNLFANYEVVLMDLMKKINQVKAGSVVISSASSLSNIVGHRLRILRPDITFLDLGTVVNTLIGFDQPTREYHKKRGGFLRGLLRKLRLIDRDMRLIW